jgi:hypothetical protein
MTDSDWPRCKNAVANEGQRHPNYMESHTVQRQCLSFGFGTTGAIEEKDGAELLRLLSLFGHLTIGKDWRLKREKPA